jgi:exonuclease SbcC
MSSFSGQGVVNAQESNGRAFALGLDALTLDFERHAEGAQLVAIAGANGRGKSTVMDNLHPLC